MTDGTNATRSSKLAEPSSGLPPSWLVTWVFMVKWPSSVTPRFLTESDKGTDAQPTVIKSGKEKERDLHFRSRGYDHLFSLVVI